MKKCAMLAALAGLATVASAQVEDLQVFNGADLTAVNMNPEAGYSSRATPVYANGRFPGAGLSFFGGLYDALDEVDFTGGPWAGVTNRVITQLQFGIGQFAAGNTADIRFEFYNAATLDAASGNGTAWSAYNNTTSILGSTTPFFTYTVTGLTTGTGIYSWFTQAPSITVPDGIDRIYVRMSILNSGTTTLWTGAGNAALPGIANDLTVGSGVGDCAWNTFNLNVAPYLTGNTPGRGMSCAASTIPGTTTPEHRTLATASNCGSTAAAVGGKGLYLVIGGDVIVPDPAGTTDLGALADGCSSRTISLASGQTNYYKVTLNGDANDSAQQFLDMDTEGSSVDTSMALWVSGTGALDAFDADSGSGTNAQLTYGIGRRPAVGDGTCYDGRSGELLATSSYIVGVTSGNATFGPNFSVQNAGTGGTAKLKICTNTNGGALAPSIAPCEVTDIGDIAALAGDPPAGDMDPGWVVWFKFSNCTAVSDDGDANATGTYVDFDFSQSFAGSDTHVMVFDSTGARVAEDDDSGTGGFSQFSWGDTSPARSAPGDGLPFAGQNGALAAGDYYMAVGLYQLIEGGANRFHVRSNSGSSLPAKFVIFSNGLTACGGGCSPCAADFNQDGGVDGGDIEAFFGAWSNGEACGDVNQDGGVDGGDIESFFSVWQAGGC